MQARGPLMIEHRLIERMLARVRSVLARIRATGRVDPLFVDAAVDFIRTYADRICSIEWVDPRHESIAWAVLATPPGTDPAACMDAARSVCPEAATLVSAGRISATSKHPTETNIVFMLDTLELYTIKRRMRAAQAKLRQDRSLDDEARRALTVQAAQDSQRQRELQKSIGGVADPFRLIGLEAAGTEQA